MLLIDHGRNILGVGYMYEHVNKKCDGPFTTSFKELVGRRRLISLHHKIYVFQYPSTPANYSGRITHMFHAKQTNTRDAPRHTDTDAVLRPMNYRGA